VTCTDAAQIGTALRQALGESLAAGAHALGAPLPATDDTVIADRVLDLLA
jgi:hypothetical protein